MSAQPTPEATPAWTGHARGTPGYRRLLAALFCAGVASFAQLYSPQAVLPGVADDLGVGAAHAALLVSVATIGLAVGVLPWSAVADRMGRVRAMSVSVGAASALALLVPLAPTMGLLLAGRFAEGLMIGGVPAIAIAYLTEEVDPRHASRAAGTYVAGTSIGGLMGRLVSGPVTEVSTWRVGVLAVAVLCAVAAVAFVRLAPAPRGFSPGVGAEDLRGKLAANLRSPQQVVLFAQAFLLMGGFVALYNFLGFRLTAPPYALAPTLVSLVFVAYLAGTWSSGFAGARAERFGRRTVLLAATATMAAGVALTLAGPLPVVLAGLVLATAGFFGAHAIASGWAGRAAPEGRAQASSLYNLAYYGGSSLVGYLGGVVFDHVGWSGVAVTVLVLAGLAAASAVLVLPRDSGAGVSRR